MKTTKIMETEIVSDITFLFTKLPVERQLFADIQGLNQYTPEILQAITELILSFLAQQSKDADQETREFAQTHSIGLKALKSTFSGIIFFLSQALKLNMAAINVRQDLVSFGLEPRRAKYIAEQFGSKFIELSETMIENTLRVNQLVDMEWKFGVTAANDELSQLGKVFLQLKLVVKRGERLENVLMELTLPQFYSFLQELQRAQAQLR